MTVASSKPIFQLIALILSAYFVYWTIICSLDASAGGVFTSQSGNIRFRPLGLRDADMPLANCNTYKFGLLQAGCPLEAHHLPGILTVQVEGNGTHPAVLALPEWISADGYYLEMLSGPIAADPVRWVVETMIYHNETQNTKNNQEVAWLTVGASVQRGQGTTAQFYSDLSFPVPLQRGQKVRFNLRPSWMWMLVYVVSYAVSAAGWLFYCLAGITQHQHLSSMVLTTTFAAIAALESASAVGNSLNGAWREALDSWLYCIPEAVLFIGLHFMEKYALYTLKIYGLLGILSMVGFIVFFSF